MRLGAIGSMGVLALMAVSAFAYVYQSHPMTYQQCTGTHYTYGDHASGQGPAYAQSRIETATCATYKETKAEWCKNYYCENTGWIGGYSTYIDAYKSAGSVQTLDLVRGWADYCVDQYPHFSCSSVDYSGDLIP